MRHRLKDIWEPQSLGIFSRANVIIPKITIPLFRTRTREFIYSDQFNPLHAGNWLKSSCQGAARVFNLSDKARLVLNPLGDDFIVFLLAFDVMGAALMKLPVSRGGTNYELGLAGPGLRALYGKPGVVNPKPSTTKFGLNKQDQSAKNSFGFNFKILGSTLLRLDKIGSVLRLHPSLHFYS